MYVHVCDVTTNSHLLHGHQLLLRLTDRLQGCLLLLLQLPQTIVQRSGDLVGKESGG